MPPKSYKPNTPITAKPGVPSVVTSPSSLPISEPIIQEGSTPTPNTRVHEWGHQLRLALIRISNQCRHTETKCIVDRYIPCLNPAFMDDSDTRFPRTVCVHGRDRTATLRSSFPEVLYFHIGQAVLAFYSLLGGPHAEVEYAKIKFVLELAEEGISNYAVVGTDSTGYKLLTGGEATALAKARQDAL